MEQRTTLAGAVKLAGTGALAALCLFVLSSNRVDVLPAAVVTPFLLLLQYHAIGWALGKLGLDYAIFTIVSADPRKTFIGPGLVTAPTAIAIVTFTAIVASLIGPLAGSVIGLAVVADVTSSLIVAELAARRRFAAIAVASLLNLPLFLVLWVLAALLWGSTPLQGIALFATTSVVRLAWVFVVYRKSRRVEQLALSRIRLPARFAVQGALNFVLFRLDQIGLATLYFAGWGFGSQAAEIGQYLFLGRVIDVVNGLYGVTTQTFFPRHPIAYAAHGPADWRAVTAWSGIAAVVGSLGVIGYACIAPLYAGPPIPLALLVCFALQIPLILLANLVTYSMQRSGRLSGLIRNQACSLLPGVALLVAALGTDSLRLLALVPVVQLTTFVLVGLFLPSGEPTAMSEPAPS